MPEFICRGWLELRGADFFIAAETEEEAKRKAAAGEWEFWESDRAEVVDAKLDLSTLKRND